MVHAKDTLDLNSDNKAGIAGVNKLQVHGDEVTIIGDSKLTMESKQSMLNGTTKTDIQGMVVNIN